MPFDYLYYFCYRPFMQKIIVADEPAEFAGRELFDQNLAIASFEIGFIPVIANFGFFRRILDNITGMIGRAIVRDDQLDFVAERRYFGCQTLKAPAQKVRPIISRDADG